MTANTLPVSTLRFLSRPHHLPLFRAAPPRFPTLLAPPRRTSHHLPSRRTYSSTPPPRPQQPQSLSFSARMKQLSKDYGYTAVGVYFGLSLLDFPFCFLAVRMLGPERVGRYEHAAVTWIKGVVGWEVDEAAEKKKEEERREMRGKEASIWTELALAYAVHKSLIFLRVPLTAAVLPKVVKVLRKWGWQVGRKKNVPTA